MNVTTMVSDANVKLDHAECKLGSFSVHLPNWAAEGQFGDAWQILGEIRCVLDEFQDTTTTNRLRKNRLARLNAEADDVEAALIAAQGEYRRAA